MNSSLDSYFATASVDCQIPILGWGNPAVLSPVVILG